MFPVNIFHRNYWRFKRHVSAADDVNSVFLSQFVSTNKNLHSFEARAIWKRWACCAQNWLAHTRERSRHTYTCLQA